MPSTRVLALAALGVLASGAWNVSVAQCPDGTPPPCRASAPAAPRRVAAPPLDDRTWIVLPFENVARAEDIEWLRSASVNLLYLDMSRWRDIRVIDDERVADFMRDVPEGRGPMGLATGMSVARRAGAGKLVMGDLLKVGSRTRVVAKVFDVRTGQRMRSVQEETSNPDSLMAVFGRLARGILNAAPPPGARGGTIGTASLGAYQEYLAGVQALNSFDLVRARERFDRALALDSTFALAHYKLSVVIGWENPNQAARLRHAETANRFAAGLPARERSLIAGQAAQGGNRWADACEIYHGMVRGDSTDVEAWYNVGECEFHDQSVVPLDGDTTRLAFNGNWNVALRAFRRTLELDPSFHLAFAHIPDILHADMRTGCRGAVQTACTGPNAYVAVLLRRGDSLELHPVPATSQLLAQQYAAAARLGTRRANYDQARDIATTWVQAGPTESRARMALGRALLRLGDLAGAERELGRATARGGVELVQLFADRGEVALKRDSFALAAALMDTLLRYRDSLGTNLGVQAGIAAAGLGRFATTDSALAAVVPPPARAYLAVAVRFTAGVTTDSTERVASQFATGPARAQGAAAADIYGPLAMWGWREMLTWSDVPPLDTAARDPRLKVAALALRGDSAGLRGALVAIDTFILNTPVEMPENGLLLASALGHLARYDSATALERLLEFDRRWTYLQPLERPTGGFVFGAFLWPRTFLLLGDLAAARGRSDVAITSYRRAAGIWQSGDAAVQPHVQRARQALARLGGT